MSATQELAELKRWIKEWVFTGETRIIGPKHFNGEEYSEHERDEAIERGEAKPSDFHTEHYFGWLSESEIPNNVLEVMNQ